MSHETIEVAEGGPADVLLVAELAKVVFVATYTGVTPALTREALEYHVSGDWVPNKAEEFRRRIERDGARLAVARAAGRIVGYRLRTADQYGGAYYVHPDFQGQGVGRRLWLAFPDTVGVKNTCITVTRGTPAVEFYQRLGFVPTGRDLPPVILRGGQELPQMEIMLRAQDEVTSVKHVEESLS